MNRSILMLLAILVIIACKKENNAPVPEPTMFYQELYQAVVNINTAQVVDLDENGAREFTFSARTINDATLNQTRLEFVVIARPEGGLLMTTGTQGGKKYNKGDSIRIAAPAGANWASLTLMIMAQKVTPQAGAAYWQGEWKDASHHYLPVTIAKDGYIHTGWIELSLDIASEKLILHKAAYSLEPDKSSSAGH